MKHSLQKGFTLIELLVVIAIIGILSSVVLASLNTARAKGANAATKSNLNNARAQAELYYDSTGSSYASVCTAGTGIATMLAGAASSSGGTVDAVYANIGATTKVTCHENGTAWAIAAPLKSPDTGYWCVDSTGVSGPKAGVIAASSAVCPVS